MKTICYTTS